MTLSQIIKLRTDSGGDIVDFLVDVMQDQYEDFRICHRLQAARLLTTYGNEDAPDFIAENTLESSPRRDRPNSKRQTKFDTELARLIREDTDDGRSIARFLVNVMVGELRSFRPHHRMAAARELLNRGFGKSARTDPEPERPARTEPIEASEPTETPHSTPLKPSPTVVPVKAGTQKPRHQATRNPPPFVVPAKAGTQKVPRLQPSLSPVEAPPLTPQLLSPHSSRGRPSPSDTLHHLPPQQFEHTVLDLLENMGYGHARHVGRTGDGDIDGIIDQDVLGLKRLYVQAKRWTNPVGEPEIRNFSGSLDAHGATRGILITTSDFTDTARRPPRPSPSEPSTSAWSTATSSPTSCSNTASESHPTPPNIPESRTKTTTPTTPDRFPSYRRRPVSRVVGDAVIRVSLGLYRHSRAPFRHSRESGNPHSAAHSPKPTIAHIENSVECPPTARTIAVRRGLIARF